MDLTVHIEVDDKQLDATIEKANRLVDLLQKSEQIIGSLSEKKKSET